ncbi:T9SS type A sorting domain-containing protein [Flammeovirga yaeyamensis]|uniref:T9SS type A sorting domain-containing protein n=2 Tax=Flammeovirga yaeyamensis TaxID=367791 RepID=A0AAX1NBE2_9BACT|nr:T9SS type A sorting domain-containing protein [Flammeovirga yaeyamensis]MBB3697255.1 hypothetical protein [Flammeovirga yaeyamensis]NMF33913.1 T9SS type A sorting domain-containing protein [Flammeovirga yaeyamensis]QWG04827.1 T9SS type A sorting domain-containing protein [Flammeovirga yaeyamensis]
MKFYLPFVVALLCFGLSNAQPIVGGHSEVTPNTGDDQTLNTNQYMELTSGTFDYGDKSITLDNNSILIVRAGVTLEVKNLSVKGTAILYVERGAHVTVEEDFIVTDTGNAEIHTLYFIAESKIEAKDGGTITGTGRVTYKGGDDYEVDGGSSVCIGTEDPEYYDPAHANYNKSSEPACNKNGNPGFNPDLPVEMIFFNSLVENGEVYLSWATATEQNASHFMVLRSFDKNTWEEVGEVEAGGNTNFRQDYSYTDKPNVVSNVVYYQLLQYDLDGKTETFGPLTVSMNPSNNLEAEVFPNPTSDHLNIAIGGLVIGHSLTISVLDKLGKTVYQETNENSGNSLVYNINDISDLESGHYLLILTSGSQKVVRRFIKQ